MAKAKKSSRNVGELVVDIKCNTKQFEADLDRVIAKFETLVELAEQFKAVSGPSIGYQLKDRLALSAEDVPFIKTWTAGEPLKAGAPYVEKRKQRKAR